MLMNWSCIPVVRFWEKASLNLLAYLLSFSITRWQRMRRRVKAVINRTMHSSQLPINHNDYHRQSLAWTIPLFFSFAHCVTQLKPHNYTVLASNACSHNSNDDHGTNNISFDRNIFISLWKKQRMTVILLYIHLD